MESNEIVRQQMLEVIENQMNSNDPPETKQTYDRLISEGFSDFDTRQMLAQCLSVEMFEVIKNQKPYDNERYIQTLKNLPAQPFDD